MAMVNFISKEIKIPLIFSENMSTGEIYCRFIVEKDGTISNIEIARGIDVLLDKEAVRIVKRMSQWIFGKPVRTRFAIPINIDFQ